jgi:hypothetical protein
MSHVADDTDAIYNRIQELKATVKSDNMPSIGMMERKLLSGINWGGSVKGSSYWWKIHDRAMKNSIQWQIRNKAK